MTIKKKEKITKWNLKNEKTSLRNLQTLILFCWMYKRKILIIILKKIQTSKFWIVKNHNKHKNESKYHTFTNDSVSFHQNIPTVFVFVKDQSLKLTNHIFQFHLWTMQLRLLACKCTTITMQPIGDLSLQAVSLRTFETLGKKYCFFNLDFFFFGFGLKIEEVKCGMHFLIDWHLILLNWNRIFFFFLNFWF